MKAFVHQRYVTHQMDIPITIPAVNANPQGGYIRPARVGNVNNRLLAGFETENRTEVKVPSLDFHMADLETPEGVKQKMTNKLIPLVPALGKTRWESEKGRSHIFFSRWRTHSGVRSKEFKGLYVAVVVSLRWFCL